MKRNEIVQTQKINQPGLYLDCHNIEFRDCIFCRRDSLNCRLPNAIPEELKETHPELFL